MENLEASKKLYESEITALRNSIRDAEKEIPEYKASHSSNLDAHHWHYNRFDNPQQRLCEE